MTKTNKIIDRSVIENQRRLERRKYNENYFRNHYWAEDLPGKQGNRGLSYDDPCHDQRFKFLSTCVLNEFEFETILDAGCGTGQFILNLAARKKNATGIDVSQTAQHMFLKKATQFQEKPNFLVSSLDNIPFDNKFFDITWYS